MSMTIVQKVLAKATNRKHVDVGEVVLAAPDVYQLLDMEMPHICSELQSEGISAIKHPDRCIVFSDHEVPSISLDTSAKVKRLTQQLNDLRIEKYYRPGRHGISHQAIVEYGHVAPGTFVLSSDTHVTTVGGVGGIGIPVNLEIVPALATGKIWLRVPETIRVTLTGQPRPGVMSRDIAQRIATDINRERADYRVIEFRTPTLTIDQRMTLCNVMVDVGAKSAVVEPDDITLQYLEPIIGKKVELLRSDEDANFVMDMVFDLASFENFIAAPPRPDNLLPISQFRGKKIDQVYIGSCAGGRMEDLEAAVHVLRGKKVHPDIILYVVPTSQQVYKDAAKNGWLEILVDAGAVILTPSCGICYGMVAPLADGEVRLCTGTSNVPGRMGSRHAEIFLSNAWIAAASAVAGYITDTNDLFR